MKAYLRVDGGWRLFNVTKKSEELTKRNIRIGNNVMIGNDVIIDNSVTISKHVKIGNGVRIGNYVTIGNDVTIGDRVIIINNVTIVNGTKVTKSPLCIVGTKHPLVECGEGLLQIGCLIHPVTYWLENYKEVGEKYKYTKKEIEEYREHIKYASKHMTIK